jgi:hypothetical protein
MMHMSPRRVLCIKNGQDIHHLRGLPIAECCLWPAAHHALPKMSVCPVHLWASDRDLVTEAEKEHTMHFSYLLYNNLLICYNRLRIKDGHHRTDYYFFFFIIGPYWIMNKRVFSETTELLIKQKLSRWNVLCIFLPIRNHTLLRMTLIYFVVDRKFNNSQHDGKMLHRNNEEMFKYLRRNCKTDWTHNLHRW